MDNIGGNSLLVLKIGYASTPPPEEEARELRMRAEEMRQMGKEYEILTPKVGQQSTLVQHCKNLEEKYTKAAEEFDALAKLHSEQEKIR